MNTFTHQIEIHASAPVIWKVMMDVEKWNNWTTSIQSIKKLNRSLNLTDLTVGTKLLIQQPGLAKTTWTVCEVHREFQFAMEQRQLLIKVKAGHNLAPIKNGTVVTLSLHFTGLLGKWAAKKYGPTMKEFLAAEASGLKKITEDIVLTGKGI